MSIRINHAALLCATLGALVYSNVLDCGFCFDDSSAVQQNQDLKPSSPWTNILLNDFWGTPMHIDGSHKSYRPLCVATFRLNYMLHELQPMGYHLVNVLLHGVVCYLYVQLCGVIFSEVWPALIAGLLFAVHPIHTEAVAGVVGRAETLSSVFFLLTIFCYKKACEGPADFSNYKWLVGSLLMCVCSVFSKEQGITAVAVCITYDVFIARNLTLYTGMRELLQLRKQSVPGWLKELLLRATLLCGFTISVMVLRVKIMKAELPIFTVHDNPAVAMPTPYRQLHWFYLCVVNLWLLLAPSFLCADWTMGTVPLITSFSDPRNLATILTFTAIVLLSWHSANHNTKSSKAAVFAIAMIAFPFIPASNLFFPVGFVVAERVLYLPSMGFCLLVGYGVWRLMNKEKVSILLKVGVALLILTHSVKTLLRNRDWQSNISLFSAAIRDNPRNGKVYNNLGHEYEAMGDNEMAKRLFAHAAKVQPDDIGAHINLGRVFKAMERYREAEEAYKVAVDLMPKGKTFRVAPSHINVYYNLANLIKMDPARQVESYELYQKALSMKPDFVEAHMNKGDLLLKMNKTQDARLSFEKAIQYKPDYTDAHFNLGTAFVQLGDRKEAERCYRRALSMDNEHLYSMLSLSSLLQDEHRLQEAKILLQEAMKLDPHNTRTSLNLAVLYLDLQDMNNSEHMLLHTLTLDPSHRSALYNIGVLYNHLQRHSLAAEYLTRLVQLYSDHLNGLQLLGDCFIRLQQPERAEEKYRMVLKQNPNHVTALHNLAVVMAGRGLFKEAIDMFSRVIELDPNHEAAKRHLEQAKLQAVSRPPSERTNKTSR